MTTRGLFSTYKKLWFFSFLGLTITFFMYACKSTEQHESAATYKDAPFWQEYHEAYPISENAEENNVRSIVIDKANNVWVATASGIFMKKANESNWASIQNATDKGPAFAVNTDNEGTVWLGTWNGIYRFKNNQLEKLQGVNPPVSAICTAKEGVYALGPHGIWLFDGQAFKKPQSDKEGYQLPRSVRDVISDNKGGLWIASDVGLYHTNNHETRVFRNKEDVISGYIKGIAIDSNQHLWAGGLGGVSIIQADKKIREITPKQGLPTVFVTCVAKAPNGTLWVGTEQGLVRYQPHTSTPYSSYSMLFSRRWLLDDHVNDIAFDAQGNAWVATAKGVSAIKRRQMTLAQKNDYFMDVLMKRHIRAPWIAGQAHLRIPGDTTTWQPEDDDNDGEYTGNYLAMESFRYAVTKSPEAKENARKAFGFLKLLQEVTDTEGFFARTVVPASWSTLHDGNRTFTPRQLADELVKEPRFKPVEVRWRKSKDGKWLWKGDTSSDEMCGHMFGYFFYYELVADEAEKAIVRQHVSRIVDYLIKHNFNFIDIDGKPTRWSVWSPDQLNRDPEWAPDRNQNSMEMLAFLKFAHHITNNEKYQQQYLRLINEEHYLENMAQVPNQNRAWFIYFDAILQAYLYPILLKCETDPERLAFYEKHIDHWFEIRKADHNPLINFIYCYSRGKKQEVTNSVDFLKDTPLDLVDWHIDHTKREDIQLVRNIVLDELQVSELPPASIRKTVRWDKNPFDARGGDPQVEREPVFWLLPYWMGRYTNMIQ
ncbi:ligand-binding sensor domain-containing protein [Emticicia fluvialis]|uniref:ligand-binding sensor domain-containing protein n=1 Tax=Emticicia fluvialis TaxID=2974474 RepID=UPI0021664AEC|nr:two-component regulator propeller domain-containing protein [Emticicia fluvialis]